MTRKNSILLSISFLIVILILSACANNESITYFDANWNETTKEHAAYYRPTPKKENQLWHIRDFYISGEKQFVGQTKDSLGTIFEGDVTWYFKTGKVESKLRYSNSKIVGEFIAVGGEMVTQGTGWDEKHLTYYALPADAEDATGQSTSVYDNYYANTSKVAIQHTSNVGYADNFSFTIYYDKEENEIGRLFYNEKSDKWKGDEVTFYETENDGNYNIVSIKSITTYHEGVVQRVQYFNENEEKIASGRLKDDAPFSGSFFKDDCRYTKVEHYQKGVLIKTTIYNNLNENIGEITFENEQPYTGLYSDCIGERTYKNGVLDGPSIKYLYEGEEDEEFHFNYKNGLLHGDYFINEDIGMPLEKGTYENGKLVGEVWYYHNEEAIEEGDVAKHYYLKANVQQANDRVFITELLQFNIDDNELLKTFVFESNTTDQFAYLDNGYHTIYREDLNSDGYNDLQIRYNHHTKDISSNTYYLFDLVSNKFQHLAELDHADGVAINTSEKTIKATIAGEFEDQRSHVTYAFLKNKLIKKLEVEEVYHGEKERKILTQVFPVPVNDYPLLDANLPPITFVQEGKEQQVNNVRQTVKLKSAPFSMTLPGTLYKEGSHICAAKIVASYDKAIFDLAKVNQTEEETPFFGVYGAMAYDPKEAQLFLSNDGYNVLYYDDSDDDRLVHVKDLNEKVSLLRFDVDRIYEETKEFPISEIDKSIYMLIFTDKNENNKIETGEIYYITIAIQENI